MPFQLQSKLAELGAKVAAKPKGTDHAVRDGQVGEAGGGAGSSSTARTMHTCCATPPPARPRGSDGPAGTQPDHQHEHLHHGAPPPSAF